jgi:hypothetical protein
MLGLPPDGPGYQHLVSTRPPDPGPLEEEKRGPTADPGQPQPEAAEVESARMLADDAKPVLRDEGFSDERIRQLADRFIAEDRGEATDDFVDWARRAGPR